MTILAKKIDKLCHGVKFLPVSAIIQSRSTKQGYSSENSCLERYYKKEVIYEQEENETWKV